MDTTRINTSPGNTIVRADELEVTKRLRILFHELTKITGMDKQAWILKTILEEVTDEINDRASENKEEADAMLSDWFTKCGLMLEWVATGEIPDNFKEDEFVTRFLTKPQLELSAAKETE